MHERFAAPKGTQIDIRDLFQRTPARFKHLKSPQYEFSLISDVIQKFAFANPDIAFRLVHNDVETFRTNGSGNLQEVLMQIYGRDLAKAPFILKTVMPTIPSEVMQHSLISIGQLSITC